MVLGLRLFSTACSIGGPGWPAEFRDCHPIYNCDVDIRNYNILITGLIILLIVGGANIRPAEQTKSKAINPVISSYYVPGASK